MLLEERTELLDAALDEDLAIQLEERAELLEAALDEDSAELLDTVLELDIPDSSFT